MKTKHKTSVSLSQEAIRLLEELAQRMGISKSDVLEFLIREKAKKENVK